MDNLLTYIKFRGDLSFKQAEINATDGVIFSILCGLNYNGIEAGKKSLKEVSVWYKENRLVDEKDTRAKEKENVLFACAESKRFKDILFDNYVCDIDKESIKTFYAVTFYTSKFEAYVVFRGTDGSLISWKENFMTLYEMPTAGQYEALKYLSALCSKPFMKVNVLGHSKGGNLALYAAMSMDTRLQKHIKNIYLYDAPGFIENIEDKIGYLNIKDRIKAYVPASCVIGNLLKPPFEKTVVEAGGNGVYQHDLFNWEVESYGLKCIENTNDYSRDISKKVNDWIDSIPLTQRENVVDELFNVFEKNGIMHFSDLTHLGFKKIVLLIMSLKSLSSENRELFGIIIKQLGVNK